MNKSLFLFLIILLTGCTQKQVSLEPFVFGNQTLRAVHLGANFGGNSYGITNEYLDYLERLNADWVGISVSLHVNDSVDPVVKRVYSGVYIPTFTDNELREMINKLRVNGYHVYLTLAFEIDEEAGKSSKPVLRYQLGDSNVDDSDWPWSVNNSFHDEFISEFWRTYTSQAVHFARIAQETGVELYSLGTETDRLFRTRSGAEWVDDFGTELKGLVRAVRGVYNGSLTYDMHYSQVINLDDPYFIGSKFLWSDLGLDVIGLSTYFPLINEGVDRVVSVKELEKEWVRVFNDYLIPLKKMHPDKPIIFTEFGYVTAINAVSEPASEERRDSVEFLIDNDGNGLDDAQEQQANIYQAFFNVMKSHPGVIDGAFLWGEGVPEEGYIDIWGVRGKLAEGVVSREYSMMN